MILVNQEKLRIFFAQVNKTLGKTAFRKYPKNRLIAFPYLLDFTRSLHLIAESKKYRRIHRLIVVFALACKESLVLMVHRHHINFRIAVQIIQPVSSDPRGNKVNGTFPAKVCKNGSADIFIGEGHKLLYEVFSDFIQNNLRIVQFQFPFIWIDIPEPETHKVIRDEIKAFTGLLRIFLRNRRFLHDKAKVAERGKIWRQRGSFCPQSSRNFPQLVVSIRHHADNGKIVDSGYHFIFQQKVLFFERTADSTCSSSPS